MGVATIVTRDCCQRHTGPAHADVWKVLLIGKEIKALCYSPRILLTDWAVARGTFHFKLVNNSFPILLSGLHMCKF